MPEFARTSVTLRICGDDLDPAWISSKLGVEPTAAHRKGDMRISVPAPTGVWSLTDSDKTRSLEEKLLHILALIEVDEREWQVIARKWQVDMFCGIFTDEWNEGTEISPKGLSELARRGITLGLDVYAGKRPGE